MLQHRTDRLLDRLRHRSFPWPLAVAAMIVGCTAVARGDDADEAPRSEPQSHIQPAGEVAAAHLPAATPASGSMASPFGLVVTRVPDLLRDHLALGHGKGLVVNEVMVTSPAAAVGFRQHDVLVSIDEQALIVPEQLVVLLAGEGPAAPKSCTLIRNGQRHTIALTAASASAAPPPSVNSAPTASATAPPLTKTKRPLATTASALALLPDKKKARALAAAIDVKHVSGIIRQTSATGLVQEDLDYSIALSCENEKLLSVSDTRGRTVFRAVIETPEQRSRIPLVVRDRVEHLERLLDRQIQATARPQPVTEIGRLDIEPVQIK